MFKTSFPVKQLVRVGLTLIAVIAAIVLINALWHAYVLAPWTRDGRVSAQIVRMAPQVSGSIIEVAVSDDQYVKQGQVLYRIDQTDFTLALAQAQAHLAAATSLLHQKTADAKRRKGMEHLVPAEEIQRATQAVLTAQAEQRSAQVAVDKAKLDLTRTVLHAPVDGYVTHLRLSQGEYASSGQANIALIDANSFWMTGYFEETKLHGIEPGAQAQIRLMGFEQPLSGRVVSLGRGITDTNQQADAQGLPSVEPSFSWIRLAQRIPVHVAFDPFPDHLMLAAGMTGSIKVATPADSPSAQGWLLSLLQPWM